MSDLQLSEGEKALGFKIRHLEDEAQAVEWLKSLRDDMEKAEANRVRLVRPLNEHVKRINLEYRTSVLPLERADKALRDAIVEFRESAPFREAVQRHAEAVRKVEEAQRDNAPLSCLVPLAEECGKLASCAPAAAGKKGELKFRKAVRMEIVDRSLLPDSYLMPDERKILEDIRGGKTIPGVRSWEETTTALT